MKVVAIIQARMGSTRLPGKVLKKIFKKSLLEYQIERVKKAKTIDEIVIATTNKESDSTIVELCKNLKVPFYQGSENDVLSRYHKAAVTFNADVVVRLTSDCQIIDPEVIDKVVQTFIDHRKNVDYVSNTLHRSYPRGLDTEVFSFKALERAYKKAESPSFREHVTAYMYNHPEEFRLENVSGEQDFSFHRWTVDTIEDFQLIENIINGLYEDNQNFAYKNVIELIDKNPKWFFINNHIEQKKV